MKKKTRCVFIILVYRNYTDLIQLIRNIKELNLESELVVVNSYYDDETSENIEKISDTYKCSFINVENRGYGYGNNRGIEFANVNFDYDYLIISNPDIIIKKFDISEIDKLKDAVIGPIITTSSKKSQNPYWVIRNKIGESLIFQGYKTRKRSILYLGIAMNKIIRELFLMFFRLSKKPFKKVFALHGSFVIYPHKVIKKIGLPYDEDMFLFAEEAHLAHLLRTENIQSFLTKSIEVLHKEDGSINLSSIDEKSELRKSVMTYYQKVYHRK